ncbi:MAG: hypothetical protein ABIG32_02805 [Candidatus Uhrbacteria bacterium]
MEKLIEQLQKLNLPKNSFAIFGSGPMAVWGLKVAGDLDLLVKKEVWDRLAAEYGIENEEKGQIVVGDIDIFWNWQPWLDNEDELIATAEMIDGWPYVRLEHVLEWKKKYGREKDLKDVELIEEYLLDKDNRTS